MGNFIRPQVRQNVQNSLGVDTSSTAMGTRITSFFKDLEHRNACVGLAGNNLELAGNGKSELQATANTLDLVDKSRRASRHNMSAMHVLV